MHNWHRQVAELAASSTRPCTAPAAAHAAPPRQPAGAAHHDLLLWRAAAAQLLPQYARHQPCIHLHVVMWLCGVDHDAHVPAGAAAQGADGARGWGRIAAPRHRQCGMLPPCMPTRAGAAPPSQPTCIETGWPQSISNALGGWQATAPSPASRAPPRRRCTAGKGRQMCLRLKAKLRRPRCQRCPLVSPALCCRCRHVPLCPTLSPRAHQGTAVWADESCDVGCHISNQVCRTREVPLQAGSSGGVAGGQARTEMWATCTQTEATHRAIHDQLLPFAALSQRGVDRGQQHRLVCHLQNGHARPGHGARRSPPSTRAGVRTGGMQWPACAASQSAAAAWATAPLTLRSALVLPWLREK